MSEVLDLVSLLHKARWCFCQFLYCQSGIKQFPVIKLPVLCPWAECKIKSPFQQFANCWDMLLFQCFLQCYLLCPGDVSLSCWARPRGWTVQPACDTALQGTRRSPWAWGHLGLLVPLLLRRNAPGSTSSCYKLPARLAAAQGVQGAILGFFLWGVLSKTFWSVVVASIQCFKRTVSVSAFFQLFCLSFWCLCQFGQDRIWPLTDTSPLIRDLP